MDATNTSKKVRIAHLSGPTATIQNTPPLLTSNKARVKHGLPLLTDADVLRCRMTPCAASASQCGESLCRAIFCPPAGIRRS